MAEINPVFRKTSKLLTKALIILLLGFAIAFVVGIFELTTSSYKKDTKDLFKLNTVTLLAKAYSSSGGRHGGRSMNFEDTERNKYRINNFVYNAITDIDFILDTLEHHGTKMTLYAEKEDYEKYINKVKGKHIEVYQLEIAGQQYVNLEDINRGRRKELIFRTALLSFVLLGLGISYWRIR